MGLGGHSVPHQLSRRGLRSVKATGFACRQYHMRCEPQLSLTLFPGDDISLSCRNLCFPCVKFPLSTSTLPWECSYFALFLLSYDQHQYVFSLFDHLRFYFLFLHSVTWKRIYSVWKKVWVMRNPSQQENLSAEISMVFIHGPGRLGKAACLGSSCPRSWVMSSVLCSHIHIQWLHQTHSQ